MPTLNKIKEISLRILQDYPVVAARYQAGDPTIVAPMASMQHAIAELSRDVSISELEPFTKSREATILADAANKGILPIATACQHMIEFINNGNHTVSLLAGRIIEDGYGRAWRLLETANIAAGKTVEVLAEQSEVREITYQPVLTEPFHNYILSLSEDLALVALSVKDQDDNSYRFVTRWMNTLADERAITINTNSLRELILGFGDSSRFGQTLQNNTVLTIQVLESYGYFDPSMLREASLQDVRNGFEQKLVVRFKEGALVKLGADPLSIDELRLLSSYPTYDENAVFLGNHDFLVRKTFMARTYFVSVWNEAVNEIYYGGNYRSINKIFVSLVAKNTAEKVPLGLEISRYIEMVDNYYLNNVVIVEPEERAFSIKIDATIAAVHDAETVKQQIKTLLLGYYGKGKIASSYFLSNGFNSKEITRLLEKNIAAFQDRTSDFKLFVEDTEKNPIKPNHWLFMTDTSISVDIKVIKTSIGESKWSVI
ncbi:hypothetical protein DJ533_00235 (plasmid) [Acinetobacter defluvii]|uniref:Uncharacterized protein n=1 Tax=Acinetobacter defluvii TaxID=1871111 RepID=A0A2S2F871_9GAMM|nr:hypothetical protein [Acinetobacter defluvii]AWL27147.1 hypothetical protein DJ533_00235 [Acinetobacter defluvii]